MLVYSLTSRDHCGWYGGPPAELRHMWGKFGTLGVQHKWEWEQWRNPRGLEEAEGELGAQRLLTCRSSRQTVQANTVLQRGPA